MSLLKTASHHVRRSPYQAFAAIFIMVQTFFVISLFAFVVVAATKVIVYFESLPQVTAFFKDEAKQDEIDTLKGKLEATDKIASVEFVSKQDAYKIYREQNKDDPLLLELVTADVLPSAFKISTLQIADLNSISEMLSTSPIVERVIFQRDVVQTLSVWTNAIRKIGIGIIAILSLDSIFIMVIIIGIKMSQKKEEIEVMRLLGATSWYVRWPFILEGMFYGVVGAFIGWIVSVGALWYASPFLETFLRGIPIFPVSYSFLFEVLVVELVLAVFLGAVASYLAVLRYLK